MTAPFQLRPPNTEECSELSDLCFRSKAHWGYDMKFMQDCRTELAVTPKSMIAGYSAVAAVNRIAVGYCELVSEEEDLVIEKLFVDPNFMGQGIGRALLDSMMDYATRHSADRILIASDPDAEQFYLNMGARRIDQTPSESIEGRLLPLLEIRMNR